MMLSVRGRAEVQNGRTAAQKCRSLVREAIGSRRMHCTEAPSGTSPKLEQRADELLVYQHTRTVEGVLHRNNLRQQEFSPIFGPPVVATSRRAYARRPVAFLFWVAGTRRFEGSEGSFGVHRSLP